ncbi:MAG: hypothetical protein KF861_06150, partial [Planctomycetaceae bacterium]|nr:hypothetical protein [Planctomycetaceae bacterium]
AELTPDDQLEILGYSDIAGQTVDEGRGRIFPCAQCGADLVFHIGVQRLKCRFCGAEKEIELRPDAEIVEQDYLAMLDRQQENRARSDEGSELGESEVRCESCGGTVVFSGTLTSSECPYCASPIQREKIHSATSRIPVDGVLPFQIDHDRAAHALADWVRSRWFAPNEFLRSGIEGKFNGVYLPFWTYDSMTYSAYQGERGDNYTVTVGTGKNRRTEVRTRWSPASGDFQRFFDDVLVIGVRELPMDYLHALEPWPLTKCLPFTQQVLAGFLARTYDVPLDQGFQDAKRRIDQALHAETCRRIGGDQQRVHSLRSRYDAITFKHLLLPVWMMAYRYRDQPYRVFINAGTGEVQGERPYSPWKIAFAVLCGTISAATAAFFFSQQ